MHVAHQLKDQFDRQLFVDLRAHTPGNMPTDPADALAELLAADGVDPRSLPATMDEQASLWRDRIAGQRLLLVIDNARDTAQVRPLLPGTPGCLVVVTSRNQLSGLVAAYGARPITIDLFTGDDAKDLLSCAIGMDRITAEPAAVDEIVAACLDHYLHTAHNAARILEPVRDQIPLTPHRAGVIPEQLISHRQALDWLTTERPVLLATIQHAAATGFDNHTWQLARLLWTFLDWQGHWHDIVPIQQAAAAATQRLTEMQAQANARLYLSRTYTRLGQHH